MIFVVYIYIYHIDGKVSTWDLSEILRCEPIRSIQVSMCFFCSSQLVTVFSSHRHPIACLDRDSWLFDHLCSDLLISGDELSATGFIPKVLKSIGFIQCRAWGVPDFPLWQIITHIICIIFVIMIYFSSSFYIYCAYIYIYIAHILTGIYFDVKHDVLRWKDVEDWREFQRAQITHGQELVANNVK